MLTLLHGDVIEQLKTLEDNSVDAIIVDPPYNLGMDTWDTWPSNKEFSDWCNEWGKEAYRILKPSGNLLSFGCTKTYHWMACGLETAGFKTRDMIEWVYWSTMPKAQNLKSCHEPIYFGVKHKTAPLNVEECRITYKEEFKTFHDELLLPGLPTGKHPGRPGYSGNTDAKIYGKALDDKPYTMNENGRHPYNVITESIAELTHPSNVIDVKKPRGKESIKEHQTQKPLALMKWLVTLTTNQDDTVLDCFGGTGTTGEAALSLGRNAILIEREKAYINIIEKRLEGYQSNGLIDF
jgi:site-specific DNA-methyltransferase (adenine-specific)